MTADYDYITAVRDKIFEILKADDTLINLVESTDNFYYSHVYVHNKQLFPSISMVLDKNPQSDMDVMGERDFILQWNIMASTDYLPLVDAEDMNIQLGSRVRHILEKQEYQRLDEWYGLDIVEVNYDAWFHYQDEDNMGKASEIIFQTLTLLPLY